MGKLARAAATQAEQGPIRTATATLTAEGGAGWSRDVRSELFLLAVTTMVGENAFYEQADDRDNRFVALIHAAVHEDAAWVARFIPWLRSGANMRTASIIAAAEYARAVRTLPEGRRAGVPGVRGVIGGALQRPDEPGEFCAYWTGPRSNSTLPGGVQRGVADAVTRLFTEKAALKYDGLSQRWRLADVIELVHPKPSAPWQADLFRYLLDRRHHGDGAPSPLLPVLRARARLDAIPTAQRAAELHSWGAAAPGFLAEAGMTWEALSGWLDGPMDTAAWTAMIPSMGLLALTRNLRNIDEAGVPDAVALQAAARFTDAEQVRRSRMFPLRFLSAFRAAPSLRWAWPLEQAVQHSLANVPSLPGRTLVLVDQSGSMYAPLSRRGTVTRAEAAALFGFAIGLAAENADVHVYGSTGGWGEQSAHHRRIDLPRGASVLPLVAEHGRANLGGTLTWTTFEETYAGHDRVVIVTDEQSQDSPTRLPQVPVVTFNLAGYPAAHMPSAANRVTVGGLSDAGFQLLAQLDARSRGDWPF
ncbi:TROVE domain-containing protein [Frankia sp. R82]|uniref:TROVE domain-containing protein n=1 Tax=Frankia sp. R82 TaxID=2950553 RepID=UPI002043A711|nr:TROVE domain-containing protein [Frankia sp. R82]MCM3884343.1 TROVE domain-containing protein [Frankia sp. R82]